MPIYLTKMKNYRYELAAIILSTTIILFHFGKLIRKILPCTSPGPLPCYYFYDVFIDFVAVCVFIVSLSIIVLKKYFKIGNKAISSTSKKILKLVVISFLLLYSVMSLLGFKIFYSEFRIEPGNHYYTEEYDYIVEKGDDSLVCRYISGLSRSEKVFTYESVRSLKGKVSCPKIVRD